MHCFGFAGWSGSGKTTLIEALVPRLAAGGLSVSVIKHTHHDHDPDRPGSDTWRHRRAGACEVMLAGPGRWTLVRENRDHAEPELETLLQRLAPCDLVLVEGFRRARLPRVEVRRLAVGGPVLWPADDDIVAIAADAPVDAPLPVFALGDHDAVARFILQRAGLAEGPRREV